MWHKDPNPKPVITFTYLVTPDNMAFVRNRAKGVAIAVSAVVCVTPDAMLLRWARLEGATPWQTAFYKMNMVGMINLCSALYLLGGPQALLKGIRSDPLALAFTSLLQEFRTCLDLSGDLSSDCYLWEAIFKQLPAIICIYSKQFMFAVVGEALCL